VRTGVAVDVAVGVGVDVADGVGVGQNGTNTPKRWNVSQPRLFLGGAVCADATAHSAPTLRIMLSIPIASAFIVAPPLESS
jgi:hypothetical protein